MSKKLFNIARFRTAGGSNHSAEETSGIQKDQGKLVEQAFGELSAMSLDEMSDALRLLEGGSKEASELKTCTLEEIYGTALADVDSESEFNQVEQQDAFDPIQDSEANLSQLVDDQLLNEIVDDHMVSDSRADVNTRPAFGHSGDLDAPISGVVKDEIALALLESDVVTMSQVFDSIRHREAGVDLWRVLCAHPETDEVQVQAAVAEQQGYTFQPDLDTPPTRDFFDTVLKAMDVTDAARLLSAGLVPVILELNEALDQYSMVVLSSDPLNLKVQAALLACPVLVECRFSPSQVIYKSLELGVAWCGEKGQEVEQFEATAVTEINFDLEVDEGEYAEVQAENVAPLDPVEVSELERRIRKDRVVRSLIAEQVVTEADVSEAIVLLDQQGGNTTLWRILADLKSVNREEIYEAAAKVYAFKIEAISEHRPDHDFVRLTMDTLADTHREEMMEMLLVPFEHSIDFETGTGRIIFITPDPTNPDVNKLVHELDLGRFELRYASESAILSLLDEIFPRKNEFLERMTEDTDAFDLGMSYDEGEDELDEDALEAEISRSKLINLFEASLVESVRQGASDIHLFPNPNRQVEIHFRTDGRLKKWHTEDKVHPEAFLAVVKDNSTNVDRFERDSAQDGFIQRDIDGALIRFRVSILPIASANQDMRAESIVIRILDDRKVLTDITKLGMLDVALDRFNQAIRQPHGMLILTGPTGSGKSTTLVAALHQVVTPEVNVLTVEDPVEYIIKGVRQIKLSNKLDLEGALRAILRHDPDIVMVGEMRDKHTAELAIKLANTGHLTFSTLHTNDAPAAVSRLYKMGVEPFLIAYAINLVVAQRLIREVCSECKEIDHDPDPVLLKSLGFSEEEISKTTFYTAQLGAACPKCNGNGYKGRRAVCETLYFTREIRNMIAESAEAIDEDSIRDQAIADGMLTLADSARVLVSMGVTTAEEMLRVTASH
jgi:type II secretory ATPase GspE/PulE/Tfp pilus assembly ATPase PilB-like protein